MRRMSFFGRPWLVVAALAISVFLSTSVSRASTVTYSLEWGAGNWQLFGESSPGDNAGLQFVAVWLNNVDLPVDLQLPVSIANFGGTLVEAFTQFRDDLSPFGGSQNLTGAGAVYNFGQSAGSLLAPPGSHTFVQQNYDAKLLVAQGTYGGAAPAFGNVDARVYDSNSGFTVHTPTLNTVVVPLSVPEPSTGVIAIIALLAWGNRARGRRR